MKKNILRATLVAVVAVVASANVYNAQQSDAMSELALANVEALANEEGGSGSDCVPDGYGCIDSDGLWYSCHREKEWSK